MDAFSYLSVLTSIILGLAIQQVLLGYRAILLSRSRVRLYAPPLIWSALMICLVTQHWWSSFTLAEHQNWSFAAFAVVLVQTILIYMMTALVLPDMPAEAELDLRVHYYREARPFYIISVVTVSWSVLREYVLVGRLPLPLNLAFHLLFIALAAILAITRRPRVHELLPLVFAASFVAYIALLFQRLGD